MRQEERQRRTFAIKQENDALQPQVQYIQPAVVYERKSEETSSATEDKKAKIEETLEYANNVSEVETALSKKEPLESISETVYELEEKQEVNEVSLEAETSLIDEKTKKKKKPFKE